MKELLKGIWEGSSTTVAAGAVTAAAIIAGTNVSDGLVGHWLTNTDDVLDWSGNENHGTNNGSIYSTDGPLD